MHLRATKSATVKELFVQVLYYDKKYMMMHCSSEAIVPWILLIISTEVS